jgi:solute carrier family 50 (sugar transporter)
LNGVFWAAYGVAVLDPFIAVPNSIGAALGGVQIVLCVLFPRTEVAPARQDSTTTDEEAQPIEAAVESS